MTESEAPSCADAGNVVEDLEECPNLGLCGEADAQNPHVLFIRRIQTLEVELKHLRDEFNRSATADSRWIGKHSRQIKRLKKRVSRLGD
jgi:hypothetical protein